MLLGLTFPSCSPSMFLYLSSCTKPFHLIPVLTWPSMAFLLHLSLQKLNCLFRKIQSPSPARYMLLGYSSCFTDWVVSACESACVVVFFCTIQRKGQNASSTSFKLQWVYRLSMSTASSTRDSTWHNAALLCLSLHTPIINTTLFSTLSYARIFSMHKPGTRHVSLLLMAQETHSMYWHKQYSYWDRLAKRVEWALQPSAPHCLRWGAEVRPAWDGAWDRVLWGQPGWRGKRRSSPQLWYVTPSQSFPALHLPKPRLLAENEQPEITNFWPFPGTGASHTRQQPPLGLQAAFTLQCM